MNLLLGAAGPGFDPTFTEPGMDPGLPDPGFASAVPAVFGVFFGLALVIGVGTTVYKVSAARRMRLRDEGLVTTEEYDARRRAIIDSI